MLIKKYQISHDRTLDGVLDELPSYRMTEAGPLDLLNVSDGSDADGDPGDLSLPGAKRTQDVSKRTTRPEVSHLEEGRSLFQTVSITWRSSWCVSPHFDRCELIV